MPHDKPGNLMQCSGTVAHAVHTWPTVISSLRQTTVLGGFEHKYVSKVHSFRSWRTAAKSAGRTGAGRLANLAIILCELLASDVAVDTGERHRRCHGLAAGRRTLTRSSLRLPCERSRFRTRGTCLGPTNAFLHIGDQSLSLEAMQIVGRMPSGLREAGCKRQQSAMTTSMSHACCACCDFLGRAVQLVAQHFKLKTL